MKRRTFISGMAAFAAAIVAPKFTAAVEQENERDRLFRLMKTGRVFNETFHVKEKIVIHDIYGLEIDNCVFIFPRDHEGVMMDLSQCEIKISNCVFVREGFNWTSLRNITQEDIIYGDDND